MRVSSRLMSNVTFNADGPPNIVLPDPPADLIAALTKALAQPQTHAAVAKVVRQFPEMPLSWATLGELVESQALDDQSKVEAYAYFRIGYHRGLDALRQNGWKGSGYVRWTHPSNTGFLRSLDGLRRMAEAIGENQESIRCADFLQMLDP